MVHQQTLAMALALDWSRSCRFWRLFVSELADLGRPVRLSPTATRALSHVVLLALERDCRLLSQSAAASQRSWNRWDPGNHFYRARLCLHHRQLVQTSTDLCDLDNRQLAAFGLRYFYRKHAAICIDDVPDFVLVCFRKRKTIL